MLLCRFNTEPCKPLLHCREQYVPSLGSASLCFVAELTFRLNRSIDLDDAKAKDKNNAAVEGKWLLVLHGMWRLN